VTRTTKMFLQVLHVDGYLERAKVLCISPPPDIDLGRIRFLEPTIKSKTK
jgi:hypothetical protein